MFQVSAIARQFARLHNALKFEALHLLSALLSSSYSVWKFCLPYSELYILDCQYDYKHLLLVIY